MAYSRWATVEELKSKLTPVSYDSEIKKSGIPMMYDENNLYIKDDEAHTLVIGSRRTIEKEMFEKYVKQNTTEKGIKLIRRYYGIIGKK